MTEVLNNRPAPKRRDKDAQAKPSEFARSLIAEWKRLGLPAHAERVVLAVSGGADSTALLLAVDELQQTQHLALDVTVALLDHGLRGEAGKEDGQWVAALAGELGFEMELGHEDVGVRATATGDNLEQAARRARYNFLAEVSERCGAHLVLTGHTMDDQAETVLLRILRGSGGEGLGGIEPVRSLIAGRDVLLARPLLDWARRSETESYCRERGVEFRTDEMNRDEAFARVRVRHRLLPLMESFNPRITEALSRAAGLLREDAEVLNAAAEELLTSAGKEENEVGGEAGNGSSASVPRSLSVDILTNAPAALRRRALRIWIAGGRGDLRRLELIHVRGIERLLEGERGGRRAELPGGSFVERRRRRLLFYLK